MPGCDEDFAFLAHDLNQLLWAIQGRAEALAAREGPAAATARAIAADAAAAAAMLRGEQVAWCEPGPVLTAAWRQAADQPGAAGGAARLQAEPGIPPVAVPPAVLRRILANLLANARQAAPDGTVHCTATAGADRVRLRVQDQGPGVPPQLRARLFAAGATAGKAGGHGLGLAGARELARRHGGDLRLVDTAGGEGACFELDLPRGGVVPEGGAVPEGGVVPDRGAVPDAGVVPGNGAVAGAEARDPGAGLELLVIDDEAPVREMLAELLEAAGHRAHLFAAADAALARPVAGRYDAALVDLGLPGCGGAAVAAALRRADPPLAVIMLTGWGRERDLADLDPAHVDLTATKPLDLAALTDLIARAAGLTAGRRADADRRE